MNQYTIGKLAKETGITVDAIRYYEKEGLIPPPRRTESNYRVYDSEAKRRILFIRHAKELGFSLKDIQELLALRVIQGENCADVRALAARKKLEVLQKIKHLSKIADTLDTLILSCEKNTETGSCPILDSIEMPGASST